MKSGLTDDSILITVAIYEPITKETIHIISLEPISKKRAPKSIH